MLGLRSCCLAACDCLGAARGSCQQTPHWFLCFSPEGLQHHLPILLRGFLPPPEFSGCAEGVGAGMGPLAVHGAACISNHLLSSCFRSGKPSFGAVAFHLVSCLLRWVYFFLKGGSVLLGCWPLRNANLQLNIPCPLAFTPPSPSLLGSAASSHI